MFKRLFTLLFSLLMVGGFCSSVWAQTPVSTCAAAQGVANPGTIPATETGQLINTLDPDGNFIGGEHFYKFKGDASSKIKIGLIRTNDSNAPSFQVWGSDCSYLGYSYGDFASLIFTVPDDGFFIVQAIGGCCDAGNVNYKLTIAPALNIGSITVNIFDSATQQPLQAYADLYECSPYNTTLCRWAGAGQSGNDGKLTWTPDNSGELTAGLYKVQVYGWSIPQYEPNITAIFAVAKDEHKTVNLPLTSYPARVSFSSCNNNIIPSQGGKCKFSATITNGQAKPIDAMVWSVVNAWGINNLAQTSTRFQLKHDYDILLPKLGSTKKLAFEFDVPGKVNNGAYFEVCTYVGGFKRNPNFNIKGTYCFYLSKEANSPTVTLLSENEARKRRHHHRD